MVEIFRLEWLDKRSNIWVQQNVPTFFAGDQVEGRVVLRLSKKFAFNSIIAKVKGEAKVQWTTTEAQIVYGPIKGIFPKSVPFRSEAIYLKKDIILWPILAATDCQQHGSERKEQTLFEKGDHQFNFSFLIPSHCPPTFEGKYGRISYSCSVNICRSLLSFDKKINSTFLVLPCAMPKHELENKALPIEHPLELESGFFRKSTTLLGKVILPKGCFVSAGEQIPIRVDMLCDEHGECKKMVDDIASRNAKLIVKLVEIVNYKAQRGGQMLSWDLTEPLGNHCIHAIPVSGQQRQSNKVMKLCSMTSIPAHNVNNNDRKATSFEMMLQVPPQCAPCFNRCPNIEIRHQLEVEFEYTGHWRALTTKKLCEIPILISYNCDRTEKS